MFYNVYYVKDNEDFDREFGIVLFDKDKNPFLFMELNYSNYDAITKEGTELNEFVDYLRTYGFERYDSTRALNKLTKNMRTSLYYKLKYIGGWEEINGRKRKTDYDAYNLTLFDAVTGEELLEIDYCYSDSKNKLLANSITENITDYEDTEEYKEIVRQEEEIAEAERIAKEEEDRRRAEEEAKASAEGRLKEYYENLLQEQERKHKEELIAMKLKEIEALRG